MVKKKQKNLIVMLIAIFLFISFSIIALIFYEPLPPKKIISENVAIIENTTLNENFFEFTGYWKGRRIFHTGNFDNWNISIETENGDITQIEGVFYTNSINMGREDLNDNLKKVFESEKYPEIIFTSTNILKNKIIGELEVKGIKKEIELTIKKFEKSIESDTIFDISQFGIKYLKTERMIDISFKLYW
jgi:hypothetical protein|tara:strand:- start:53 stop:619 length:567 start_codon:yes stop_codon:yes gene_type:complete